MESLSLIGRWKSIKREGWYKESQSIPRDYPGKLVTFEGPERSGKSSLITSTKGFVKMHGVEVVSFCEPGQTNIGNQIREVIHDMRNTKMSSRTELFCIWRQERS